MVNLFRLSCGNVGLVAAYVEGLAMGWYSMNFSLVRQPIEKL
jgi:hypothetical protein